MKCVRGEKQKERKGAQMPRKKISTEQRRSSYTPKVQLRYLNEDIKILRNKKEFKSEFKKYFINQLNSNINCNFPLCVHCHLQR